MKLILPYVFSLLFWIAYFLLSGWPQGFKYIFIIFFGGFLIIFFTVSGRLFYRHWNLWLNYLIYLLSSLVFVLLPLSPSVRILYGIIAGMLAGLAVYSMQQYYAHKEQYVATSYLELTHFLYLLTLWQVAVLAYFSLIFISASLWSWVMAMGILVPLLANQIFRVSDLKKSSRYLVITVMTLTTAELFAFIYQLPVHYYVAASIVALWFYFILAVVIAGQELASRRILFRKYSYTLFIVIAVILITALMSQYG